jgi:hypothetical protein
MRKIFYFLYYQWTENDFHLNLLGLPFDANLWEFVFETCSSIKYVFKSSMLKLTLIWVDSYSNFASIALLTLLLADSKWETTICINLFFLCLCCVVEYVLFDGFSGKKMVHGIYCRCIEEISDLCTFKKDLIHLFWTDSCESGLKFSKKAKPARILLQKLCTVPVCFSKCPVFTMHGFILLITNRKKV